MSTGLTGQLALYVGEYWLVEDSFVMFGIRGLYYKLASLGSGRTLTVPPEHLQIVCRKDCRQALQSLRLKTVPMSRPGCGRGYKQLAARQMSWTDLLKEPHIFFDEISQWSISVDLSANATEFGVLWNTRNE